MSQLLTVYGQKKVLFYSIHEVERVARDDAKSIDLQHSNWGRLFIL